MPINEFGPDGTQAPPPPRLFPDPLAGLVTADKWLAPQWTSEYSASRVSVPTPPVPTEEVRQAIWQAMQQEQRRPRVRRSRPPQNVPQQVGLQAFAPTQQMHGAQQQQPVRKSNGVAAFIGCLIVIGFFVLVLVNILGAIFSG